MFSIINCAEKLENSIWVYTAYRRDWLVLDTKEGDQTAGVYLNKKEVKRLRKYLKRWLESLEEGE